MKCTQIMFGDTIPEHAQTLEQFIGSEQSKSAIGQLLIALTEETAWSSDYEVEALLFTKDMFEPPRLFIRHKTFVLPLILKDKAGTDLSLRGTENAVRAHLWERHEKILTEIAHLQKNADDLADAAYQIVIEKARAAVVAAFPEASGSKYIPCQAARRHLHAFAQNGIKNVHSNPLYVVRVVDEEVADGVACIESTVLTWCQMREEARLERFLAKLEAKPVNRSLIDRHMTP